MKNNGKRKSIILLIFLFVLAGCICQTVNSPAMVTKAYTEEQKQQVKEWLSAHGYPPTMEGAYQAYSDYQSGKLKLSEEDQKRVEKTLGKSSSKDKDGKKKKKTSKKKSKKKKSAKKSVKKSADKRNKVAAEPETPTADKGNQEEQKQQTTPSASPSVKEVTQEEEAEKCGTQEEDMTWKTRMYVILAFCAVAVGASLLFIRKKKSPKK